MPFSFLARGDARSPPSTVASLHSRKLDASLALEPTTGAACSSDGQYSHIRAEERECC